MTEETPSIPITGAKKTIVIIMVGVVGALCLGAMLLPEARGYTTDIVKQLLGTLVTIIK